MNQENSIGLYELSQLIKSTIDNNFSGKFFWVKAELHKLNYYQYSGHAYPELLEKRDNEVICQMKGTIWKIDFQRIQQKFLTTTGEPLKENIHVLMLVSVRYESKYGLSIQIKDIDPNYTLGELEKQKKQTIEKLKSEGIFDANKFTTLAIIPQRLAVISVETSKGYNDLITAFKRYERKYHILHDLYPSLLQGEQASYQIREMLNVIKTKIHFYDAVLIIRGGGGDVGLSCYNDYDLCKTIATFPIPVITGIGHSTNFTVAEMVAYHNGITPTDVAMFIIQKFEQFEQKINEIQNYILSKTKNFLEQQHHHLHQISQNLVILSKELFYQQNIALKDYQQFIQSTSKRILNAHHHHLVQIHHQIRNLSVQTIFEERNKLQLYRQKLKQFPKNLIHQSSQNIQYIQQKIIQSFYQKLQLKKLHLQNLEKNLMLLHPQNTLKRGYSIIFDNNKHVVKSAHALNENQEITITFHSSEATGKIIQLKIKENDNK
ncbi:MAG: exodeoxyribonuclease VII large subunit [Bacteroidia bacterium]